jgi:hypothetical protein
VLPGIAVLTHRRLFQFLLGASGVKLDPVLKGKEARDSFMHINDLKKKYAAITAKAHPDAPLESGLFPKSSGPLYSGTSSTPSLRAATPTGALTSGTNMG